MNPTGHPAFGPHIHALRKRAGMTQGALANKIDVEPQYISHIETGRRRAPSEKVVRRLAAALRADVGEMLTLAIWSELPTETQMLLVTGVVQAVAEEMASAMESATSKAIKKCSGETK